MEALRDDQLRNLNRLKEWIYRQRTKIRQERDRAERRQQKEAAAAERKELQPALFDL